MTVPAPYFENRQSCWKHPNNRFFLRGYLWMPGMPDPNMNQWSNWMMYVGPFTSTSDAGMTSFLLGTWAFKQGWQWFPGGREGTAGRIACVWGPDAPNGLVWPVDTQLRYTWIWEDPSVPLHIRRAAKYRRYKGLPGKYEYLWEGPDTPKLANYHTDGVPGWTGA